MTNPIYTSPELSSLNSFAGWLLFTAGRPDRDGPYDGPEWGIFV